MPKQVFLAPDIQTPSREPFFNSKAPQSNPLLWHYSSAVSVALGGFYAPEKSEYKHMPIMDSGRDCGVTKQFAYGRCCRSRC